MIKIKDMILASLFAALTAVGAYISIPIPYVPITLQVFFVVFSGIVLGARIGMLSQIIYTLVGLVGVPVFAGGTGGFQSVMKPSFGYVIGFIIAAYVIGYLSEMNKNKTFLRIFFYTVIGLVIIYIIGTSYMYLVFNLLLLKPKTISTVIKIGIIPFIPGDIIKCIMASAAAVKVVPILEKEKLHGQVNRM